MEVINCKSCGRLYNTFNSSKKRLCPQCTKKLEEKFTQVKEFIREYPNCSIEVVATENDVSIKQIKQWVREERLIFVEGCIGGVTCEKCGKSITTGRFCGDCKFRIGNTLMSAIDKPIMDMSKRNTSDKDRMRFLQNPQTKNKDS